MNEIHNEIDKLRNYIKTNLNPLLTSLGVGTIDSFRIGFPKNPSYKGGASRTLGVYVDPDMVSEFDRGGRTDCEIAICNCHVIIGMILDKNDDDGDDTLVYKYSDALARVLSEYRPARDGSLNEYQPQLARDDMLPAVFFSMTLDVAYNE